MQQPISTLLLVTTLAYSTVWDSPANDSTPAPKHAVEANDPAYRWFSLPIDVRHLPAHTEFVLLNCMVDFTDILRRLGVDGVVDQPAFRLVQLGPDGREFDEPYQFSVTPQPRLKQKAVLPDTPPNVSYLGEYKAGVTPQGLRVAGELAWAARADKNGAARYRLEFGIRRVGSVVQVPYPPHDLHVFDEGGLATPVRGFPRMQIRPQWPIEGRVELLDGRDLVTRYHLGPTLAQVASRTATFRRPFLYPVNGPDGIGLTEVGKPHDPTGSHAHHYSLWIAHNNIDGKDFWGEKGGAIVHEQLESLVDGPLFCRVVQKTRWIQGEAALLKEKRRLTLYHTPDDFRILDIELELTPAGKADVTLDKTSFGFLAARVAQSMTVFDGGGAIINSRGERNERGAHLRPAEWIDQSGPIAPDKWNGIALFDHPDNINHPTTWHCRNDGWAGASFNGRDPYIIKSEQSLRLRYRVLLHRGNAEGGHVARRYTEYVARPEIRIGNPVTRD